MNFETNSNPNPTTPYQPPVTTEPQQDYPPQGYPTPEQPKKSKKTLWIIIACIVALLLIFSFAGQDEEVAAVEDLIENIGVVTLDSEPDIQAAEEAYEALPSEKQKKVSNLDVLKDSKDEYTDLVIDSFQSSEMYSKLQSILISNLSQYNPLMRIDRDKMALVITMAVDSSIGTMLKDYPALARESWSSVVTNFNSMGSSCYQIAAQYKLDVILQVYSGSTSSTLLLESVNGVTSYNILD